MSETPRAPKRFWRVNQPAAGAHGETKGRKAKRTGNARGRSFKDDY